MDQSNQDSPAPVTPAAHVENAVSPKIQNETIAASSSHPPETLTLLEEKEETPQTDDIIDLDISVEEKKQSEEDSFRIKKEEDDKLSSVYDT